jgi:hypothetical protein
MSALNTYTEDCSKYIPGLCSREYPTNSCLGHADYQFTVNPFNIHDKMRQFLS